MSLDNELAKNLPKLIPLRIWVIVNPTSGGNRGEKLVKKLASAIRKKILVNSSNIVETTLSELMTQAPPICFPQMPETPCSAIVVRTTESGQSTAIAANISKTYIHFSSSIASLSIPSDAQQRSFNDIVVAIGGDGTLSEVVHGLCTGTLEVVKKPNGSDRGSESWSADATVLSRHLPRLVYLPSGTGADFARLGFNCQNIDEVISVLKCLIPTEDSNGCTPVGNSSSSPAVAGAANGSSSSTPRFQSCRIDIGSVMYPKTGTRRYFVNECSVGMSSDVIIKSENYKKTWLRHFGGLIIFFAAAIVALVQMKPKSMRLRRLPCGSGSQPKNTSMVSVPCPSGKDGRAVRLTPAEIRADLEIESRWVDFPASTIAFGNGKFFGGGMMICPHGDPTDQLFAVTAWYATFWAFVLRMFGVYNGNHVKWAETTTLEGSRFEVDVAEGAVEQQFCETDGELGEQLPAIIEFMGSMNMLRPSGRKSQ
jgi:diacylglycerol kinase family enzyme